MMKRRADAMPLNQEDGGQENGKTQSQVDNASGVNPQQTESGSNQASAAGKQKGGGQQKPEKRYSILVYVVILFAVMLLLITLSYFIQQRNNKEALESLSQNHSEFSLSALEKIENLQTSNLELTEKVENYEDEIKDLKEKLAEAEAKNSAGNDNEAKLAELEKKYNKLLEDYETATGEKYQESSGGAEQ